MALDYAVNGMQYFETGQLYALFNITKYHWHAEINTKYNKSPNVLDIM